MRKLQYFPDLGKYTIGPPLINWSGGLKITDEHAITRQFYISDLLASLFQVWLTSLINFWPINRNFILPTNYNSFLNEISSSWMRLYQNASKLPMQNSFPLKKTMKLHTDHMCHIDMNQMYNKPTPFLRPDECCCCVNTIIAFSWIRDISDWTPRKAECRARTH